MSFRLPRGQFFQRTRSPSVADQDYRWASTNQCNSARCFRLVKSLQQPQPQDGDNGGNNNNHNNNNNNNNNIVIFNNSNSSLNNNKISSTVFKAIHLSSGHTVVVKLIDLDKLGDLENVVYEVAHLKHLHHDNLIPLLASFVDGSHLWNIFTLAEYSSADLCARPYGLPELAIVYIVKDVLSALSYLHKRGLLFACCFLLKYLMKTLVCRNDTSSSAWLTRADNLKGNMSADWHEVHDHRVTQS